jgi:hypothetical protein
MGEIVNLRQARKATARAQAAATAAARRAQFGRTRAEVVSQKAEQARAARVVDGALLEPASGRPACEEQAPPESVPTRQPLS